MVLRWRAALCTTILAIGTSLFTSESRTVELPMCKNKKIFVLDMNTFAGEFPACKLDEVAIVNPGNGIVYTPEARLRDRASHKYGTHSAPWYVAEAIKSSQYITHDINEADLVFVDNYCYYIWWLGWVHAKGRDHVDTPGDYLVAAFTGMVNTEHWKRNGGRNYVFYDSHPGFTAGKAGKVYWAFVCHMFKDSMHIVVERAQRNVCPTYWEIERKMLITPYVPNFVSMDQQYRPWETPLRRASERRIFIYAKARCTPFGLTNGIVVNVGKKMRFDFASAMNNSGLDVQVQCTDAEYGMKHEDFYEMLAAMQSSKFCLALPGDAASVRRMSEIFMAGCLPVFVGPPFATMPLPADVDYRGLGLYYNVTDYHSWQTQDFQWSISPTIRANHPQNSWFWVPDADINSLLVNINNVNDLLPALRKIPESKIDSMMQVMQSQRQMFVFHDHLTQYWSAVNAIISRMCLLAGNNPSKKQEGEQQIPAEAADHTAKRSKERQKRARRSHVGAEAVHLKGENAST